MQKTEIRKPSEVTKAVLYTDRALVTRTLEVEFEQAGSFQVVAEGLPENIDEASFRVTGKGQANVLIADVKLIREFHQKVPNETIRDLQTLIEQTQEEAKKVDDQLKVLEDQRGFLNSVQEFSAEAFTREVEVRPPNVEDWEKMLDFQGRNRRKLNDKSYALLREKKAIQEKIQKLQADLNQLRGAAGKWRKNAVVEVEVDTPGDLTLSLSYQVRDASWKPFYEARVDSETKNVRLSYFGLVEQRSGEDWTGIALELSTARPHIGGNPPTLHAWYLRPWTPPPPANLMRSGAAPGGGGAKRKKMAKGRMERETEEEMDEGFAVAMSAPAPVPARERTAEVSAGPGASVQFLVPGESDVPGDGSSSKHKIMEQEFPCKFRYLSLPKLAELVYLTAEVENTSDFPLLPGKMNIFRDGGFIGSANISQLVTSGETFELNLGVDEAVRIKRKLLKRKGAEKGLFTKNRRMEYAFQIQVENKRKTDEVIVVRDQIPVSQEEKIEVEVTKIEPTENPAKDKEKLPNGTIEWSLEIPAGSAKNCELAFTVEHPREMKVDGMI